MSKVEDEPVVDSHDLRGDNADGVYQVLRRL